MASFPKNPDRYVYEPKSSSELNEDLEEHEQELRAMRVFMNMSDGIEGDMSPEILARLGKQYEAYIEYFKLLGWRK